MLEPACREAIGRRVLTLQIVVGALVAGLLVFLVVVLVVIQEGMPGAPEVASILTYVAVGLALTAVLVRLFVPDMIVARGRRQIGEGAWQMPRSAPAHGATGQQHSAQFVEQTGDAGRLFLVFQTRTIVAAALLEGPAFFALIAYMLGRSPLAMIVALLLILGVALHFPTQSGVLHWIEEQLRRVDEERQFGR